MMLLTEVEMWEITEIVIPNVMAKWEQLAYCMRYKPREVRAFRKDSQDLKECCMKLFSDWLETDHGPVPKTYQTLLNCIKKITDLQGASKEIEMELIEGNYTQIALLILTLHNLFISLQFYVKPDDQ